MMEDGGGGAAARWGQTPIAWSGAHVWGQTPIRRVARRDILGSDPNCSDRGPNGVRPQFGSGHARP